MGKPKSLVLFFNLFCLFNLLAAHQHLHLNIPQPKGLSKLFVFGDSYADTGNTDLSKSKSWKQPYGNTFPGKPTGRFSDGRVLTDYIASFMGIESPIPYEGRKTGTEAARNGMNFAYGGTGVFQTQFPEPNMTTQILFFQRILQNEGLYTTADVASSLALVSCAGNDYGAYIARGDNALGLAAFIPKVVNQLALNLKSIHDMGVKKIAVIALEPLGCLPRTTKTSSYMRCNTVQNIAVQLHNILLQQAVAKLNKGTNDSAFHILDLYGAFMSIIKKQGGNILEPCCMGLGEFSCGGVDATGAKKYTVCKNPESSFFWDNVHPSQSGWHSVFSALQPSLYQLHQ